MKRREALKIIEDQMKQALFFGAENIIPVHAEHLLHELEKAGMLPPIPNPTGYGPKAQASGGHKWEKE